MPRSKNRKRQRQRQRANQRQRKHNASHQPDTLAERALHAWRFVRESFTPPPDFEESPREPLRWYNLRRHEISVLALAALIALGSISLRVATLDEPVGASAQEPIKREAKLRVNEVPAESLRVIPGVGEAISARIVTEREAGGPFTSLQDMSDRVHRFSIKRARPFERYLDFSDE